ncbi:MAG: hypothetical protein BYD32DRAFT_436813 [Podila humilis]|nr:MAG: hypothetical protein BYD32DRAFT_436813 [Podila humilis]
MKNYAKHLDVGHEKTISILDISTPPYIKPSSRTSSFSHFALSDRDTDPYQERHKSAHRRSTSTEQPFISLCTGSKDFQYTTRVVERLECTVTRSDGFKSYPSGTAKGDFPSVCNGDYCMTQRWSDCSYVDLSVNGKTYSGKGSCEQWELNYTGGLKAYRRSRLSLGCQF